MTDRTPLAPEAVHAALAHLGDWSVKEGRLVRDFEFRSFREAMGFLVRVAFEAEGMDHHPEIRNVYNRVRLALVTHSAGDRITAADIELARRISAISRVQDPA